MNLLALDHGAIITLRLPVIRVGIQVMSSNNQIQVVGFSAGDVRRFLIQPTLDNVAIEITTPVRVLVLIKEGVSEQIVIPSASATYDASVSGWTIEYTQAQTQAFRSVPADPTSRLRANSATMVIELGTDGALGTYRSPPVPISKGYMD